VLNEFNKIFTVNIPEKYFKPIKYVGKQRQSACHESEIKGTKKVGKKVGNFLHFPSDFN